MLDIPEIIKEHHQAMIDKGFYGDEYCPTCDHWQECPHPYMEESGSCDDYIHTKNIGELLMLIVSELGEALEAHRNKRFTHNHVLKQYPQVLEKNLIAFFEENIKDTFEDEIADVFLRLFDLCGYLEIEHNPVKGSSGWEFRPPNVADKLRIISQKVLSLNPDYPNDDDSRTGLGYIFLYLDIFCKEHNIPIEKHILAKMAYNKTRPHKHGKEY